SDLRDGIGIATIADRVGDIQRDDVLAAVSLDGGRKAVGVDRVRPIDDEGDLFCSPSNLAVLRQSIRDADEGRLPATS
ncbi:MAG: hypothetical protein IJR14_03475, partial [Synergistaceae bacterium]|nr:hypothetical protein [Synergistaceae bacterium]